MENPKASPPVIIVEPTLFRDDEDTQKIDPERPQREPDDKLALGCLTLEENEG